MNDQLQLPSDLALVQQARAGSEAAWTELRSRHVDAVEALARAQAPRKFKRSVDAVFDQLRGDTAMNGRRSDDGRSVPIRPRAIKVLTGGSYSDRSPTSRTSFGLRVAATTRCCGRRARMIRVTVRGR